MLQFKFGKKVFNPLFLFQPQKNGSLPISLFFRKVFEFKNIKLILGINLAISAIILGGFGKPINALVSQEAVLPSPENIIHTETTFKYPVLGSISQKYHWYHPGIDINNSLGTPIYPIAEGVVKEVVHDSWGYGHKIIITHDKNFQSLYAHLDKIMVKPGQKVKKDTIIANIGLTGWTTGPHLHLEIKKDNNSINPLLVLPDINH